MKKYINLLICLFKFILISFLGILYIIDNDKVFTYSFLILGISMFILAIFKIYSLITKKELISIKIIDIILSIIGGILLITKTNLFIILFTKLLGIYILIQSICGLINLYIYKLDKLKGKVFVFITTLSSFIASILLLIKNKDAYYLSLIIGIFLIIYATAILLSYFEKRKIIIYYPNLFTMFLPRILIKRINRGINIKKINHSDKSDLEILIHLAKDGTSSLGHVELGFEGKIFSYSCYNYQNRKLFGGIGDGILGIFDHDSYIKYCVEKKARFILSYGIKLEPKEKEDLALTLKTFINTNTIRWYPEVAFYKPKKDEYKEFKEMANQIYLKANGIFYKFDKGVYKTFFVFRNNCVKFVEHIMSSLNNKSINIYGLISPGTYYSYLEKEFNKKNSRVVSKNLYTKEYISKLNYQYIKKSN